MYSINMDDATVDILGQNTHHTPAYWWRGESDEANQYIILVMKLYLQYIKFLLKNT